MSTNDSNASTWWRRQRFYLLGALLLGAWALYAPYREAWHRYARMHPMQPIEVAHEGWGQYEGARWRLLNVTARDKPDLREDAMVLVARFEMIADAGADIKKLDRCKGRLTDARGRVWDADPFMSFRQPRTLPSSCASGRGAKFEEIQAKPGEPWQFELPFVVPRGLEVKTLRPEIFIPWADLKASGTYLRFNP